jgi:hypothetical protein
MPKFFGGHSGGDSDSKSIEDIEKFEHVHEAEESPVGTSMGSKAGFTTLGNGTQKLYVTEKLFAHAFTDVLHFPKCPDTIRVITPLPDKKKKIAITAKTANTKNRVTLLSQKGEALGVVQQAIHLTKQTYHIYGLDPLQKGEKRHHAAPVDKVHHQGRALFPYGVVEVKSGDDVSLNVYQPSAGAYRPDVYTLERLSTKSGGWFSTKPFLVKRLGIPAALLRKGDFPDGITGPAWDATVAPGIDPILIVGLIAIMDTQNL